MDDHEKPLLICQPCSEKLPIVLSTEDADPSIQVPASIAQYLSSYQRDGVRFLYRKFSSGEGGILADDMGLGKTIQSIAFIAAVLQMKGTKEDQLRHCSRYIREDIAPGIKLPSVNPVLIICPASLSDNWQDEFHTWGYFKVYKLTTDNRLEITNRAKHRECDVVMVTFEIARKSIDYLNDVDWTCVIVDEVHRIKDTNSQISKALCSLQCQQRYGLTGTPFQNNMTEFWCLINWSNPGVLGDRSTFYNEIARYMEHGQRRNATKGHVAKKQVAQIKLNSIRRQFLLRRTKDILAKILPPKTDQIVFCELTPVQRNIYRMIVQSPDVQKLLGYWKDGSCEKNAKRKARTGLLFTYLHLLQKTANHVGLLASGLTTGSDVAQTVCTHALEECAGLQDIAQKRWPEALSDVNMSGKMLVLSQLLPVFLEKRDKILIFSYSTKILDLVQKYLVRIRCKHLRLDGTTPPDTRFELVRLFNKSPDLAVFLLSTKAGGFGLNIVGANVVIIFDPNWNPAYDLQAQDRAYRLGQEREVRVYRLLSTSTIEEFVYLRQLYKQQLAMLVANKKASRLFNSVPGDSRYYGELFGIHNLFSFRESALSLTEEILAKQKNLELTVRLKMEAPSKDDASGVYVAACATAEPPQSYDNTNKSGLIQLCEDVFETTCDDPVEDHLEVSQEVEAEGQEEEQEELDEVDENINRSGSINAVLEKSSAVRNIVEHGKVIAPSSVEDFVSDCAVRDVLQKGRRSHVSAFDCSVGTQDDDEVCDENLESDGHRGLSTLCRLKFDRIAHNEYLNPYELATKVMSMTQKEKEILLKKHLRRKRKSSCTRDADSTKHLSSAKPEMKNSLVSNAELIEKVTPKNSNLETNRSVSVGLSVASSELSDSNISKTDGLKFNVVKTHSAKDIQSDQDLPGAGSDLSELSDSNISKTDGLKFNVVKTHSTKDTRSDKDLSGAGSDVNNDTQEENSQSNCSETSSSSSFEKSVTMCIPNASKETISLLEKLICNKRTHSKPQKVRKRHQEEVKKPIATQANVACEPLNCQDEYFNESINAIDKKESVNTQEMESSLLSGAALIESLFFSSEVKKISPNKRLNDSFEVKNEASTSGLGRASKHKGDDATNGCVSRKKLVKGSMDEIGSCNFDSDSEVNRLLDSTIFKDFRERENPKPLASTYKSEDDLFRKLVKSGKLKRV